MINRTFKVLLAAALILTASLHGVQGDWVSDTVERVSNLLGQASWLINDPNKLESYSAAQEAAQELQDSHKRRAQRGEDSWTGILVELWDGGLKNARKFAENGRSSVAKIIQAYSPQYIKDLILRLHGKGTSAATSAAESASAAASAAAGAAASVGSKASEAVGGSDGSISFSDAKEAAQDGVEAVRKAAEGVGEKVREAASDLHSEL